jgi:hypothetical protein
VTALINRSELAEEGCGALFTLDSDFQICRRNRRRKIPLLIPPGR